MFNKYGKLLNRQFPWFISCEIYASINPRRVKVCPVFSSKAQFCGRVPHSRTRRPTRTERLSCAGRTRQTRHRPRLLNRTPRSSPHPEASLGMISRHRPPLRPISVGPSPGKCGPTAALSGLPGAVKVPVYSHCGRCSAPCPLSGVSWLLGPSDSGAVSRFCHDWAVVTGPSFYKVKPIVQEALFRA